MRSHVKLASGAAAVSLFMLVGCQVASPADDASSADAAGSPVVAPAAQREEVTRQAYEAAYSAFSTCMSEKGSALVAESVVGVVHDYSFPADGVAAYEKCYPAFARVDMDWQIANTYDSPTFQALRGCLTVAGIVPATDAEGVWKQVTQNGIDPEECTLGH